MGFQNAAGGFAQADAVAGAGLRWQRQVFVTGRRAREQRLAARNIIRETAGGQHHTLAGADVEGALERIDPGTQHIAVFHQQLAGGRRLDQYHAQVFSRLGQAPGQRHAVDQMHGAAMHGKVAQVGSEALGHMDKRLERAGHAEEGTQIGASHDRHAEKRGLAHGLAHAFDQPPHLPCIVGRRNHLMALGRGPWHIAMDVRNTIAVGPLQRGKTFEKSHHVRRIVEEGIHSFGVVMHAQFVLQVGARLLRILNDPRAPGQRITRHPRPTARPRRCAAKVRIFLHDHDLQPMPGGRHRSREARSARTDNQQIAINLSGLLLMGRCHEGIPGRGGHPLFKPEKG